MRTNSIFLLQGNMGKGETMNKILIAASIALVLLSLLAAGIGCSKSSPSTTATKPPTTTSSLPPTTTNLSSITTSKPPTTTTTTNPPLTTTTTKPPTTTATTTSVPTTSTTTPTTSGAVTAKDMANSGNGVFGSFCAACHGSLGGGGSGPAIIGQGSSLAKYANAGTLFSFISSAMPQNNPGGLTTTQYTQLLAYLLVQNNYISPTAIWDSSKLSSITMK